MARIFTILVVVIAVIGGTWWWLNRPEALAVKPTREIKTIVAYGDSLTYGVGSTQGHDYVSDLSAKIGKPIMNMGESGDTTAQGYARIDKVIKQDPDMVLLLLGGNDALQRVPIEQTFKNLDAIISELQSHGAIVVLMGIQGGALSDPYEKPFKELKDKYHLPYVPNVIDGLYGRNDLMYDAVHPNDAGYALIAEKVYKVIKPILDYKI